MKALELLKSFDVKDRGERHGGRFETRIGRLYAITDKEVVVLETLFSDAQHKPQGFHGATGIYIRPVLQSEIDRYLDEPDEEMWRLAVQDGRTTDSLDDWWKEACDEADCEGLLYPYDDPSYRAEFEYLLENASEADKHAIQENVIDLVEENGDKVVAWSCSRGGRCLPVEDNEMAYLFDPDLMRLVKLFEKD